MPVSCPFDHPGTLSETADLMEALTDPKPAPTFGSHLAPFHWGLAPSQPTNRHWTSLPKATLYISIHHPLLSPAFVREPSHKSLSQTEVALSKSCRRGGTGEEASTRIHSGGPIIISTKCCHWVSPPMRVFMQCLAEVVAHFREDGHSHLPPSG